MGRLFWRFFLIVGLAQWAAVVGTGVAFWLEHRGRPDHPPPPPPAQHLAAGPSDPAWLGPPLPGEHAPPGAHGRHRPPPHDEFHVPLIPLVIGLLASVVCAAGLAWYVARPIRLLQQAFAEVAQGRLQTRIGQQMGRRRDELAGLGADFDRMAERLQQLVLGQRRLLHDVSHEMRSPLARLLAAIGLARQQPQRVDELLGRIERESERLDALVGEVLALARAESGSARGECFDLRELLLTVVDDAAFEGAAREVQVMLDCPQSVYVHAVPELLLGAVDNVVRNALRFSPPAGVLQLCCREQAGEVRLSIADQGPGVAAEWLERIFEPFARIDAQEGQGDGYGLGLAIARRAVLAAGGQIFAENREEGGLRVVILLPATTSP